jgi:branched-chain amino acid transport system ATP-binding protein
VSPILTATEITKRFAGITALDGVSLEIEAGELVGLIGPNGAGKTTFFNCLLGMLRPDSGRVLLDGRDVTRAPVFRRARMGMGRTFQRMELFVGTTVRDHLLVAERARSRTGSLAQDLMNRARPTVEELDRTEVTLALLGLEDVADAPVESLPLGRGRLVELARTLMTEPRVLLLDEPSSGLDHDETAVLANTLRAVQTERDLAIVLVEHDLEMVRRSAPRLVVLDFGMLIATGPTEDVLADAAVRRAYLGETE